jgi:hypothetical protein
MTTPHEIAELLIRRFSHIEKNDRSSDHQWGHCFKYFSGKPNDHDLGCLHLGFYLASWGMYRGSARIRDFDHLIHEPIVKEVLLPKYDPLRGASFEGISEHLPLIWELRKKIEKSYPDSITVTETLLTKILMGTLGCVPAYDRYLKAGLAKEGIVQTFSEKGFRALLTRCKTQSEGFLEAHKQTKYPVMRLVDMYYFAVGEGGGADW